MPAELLCTDDVKVELSEDGTTWIDITAFTGRVDPAARERPLITYKTFGGTLSCTGTADPVNIELEFVYTEADSEPYAIVRDAHYAGSTLSLRYQVNVGVAAKQWVAPECTVPTFDEPEINASSDAGIITLATLSANTITWLTATP